VWIGSHSRNSDGELRPARAQLFSTDIVLEDGVPRARFSQKLSQGSLLEAFASVDQIKAAIAITAHTVPTLAPKQGGFNIEGLSVAEDSTSLVVGLRNPPNGKRTYLLRVNNAAEALNRGTISPGTVKVMAEVEFGEGRGIRSLEYSSARKGYFAIVGHSGPDAERPEFDLYLWDGMSSQATLFPGLREKIEAAGLSAFQPEALAIDSTGTRILVLSDDENRCGKNSFPANSFRGVIVTLR
jgi:hypothetical protein